jgi:hypothetical protein
MNNRNNRINNRINNNDGDNGDYILIPIFSEELMDGIYEIIGYKKEYID